MKSGEEFSDVRKYLKQAAEESRADALTLRGMLKESDKKDHVAFAPSQQCDQWLDIPISTITSVTHLGFMPCRRPDEEPHQHPFVNIAFKSEGSVAEGLLQIVLRSQTSQTPGTTRGRGRMMAVQAAPATMAPRFYRVGAHGAPVQLGPYAAPPHLADECPYGVGPCGDPFYDCWCGWRSCYKGGTNVDCIYDQYCQDTNC